jgi:hypothetical protein
MDGVLDTDHYSPKSSGRGVFGAQAIDFRIGFSIARRFEMRRGLCFNDGTVLLS